MTLLDVCELIVDCPHSTAPDEGQGYPLIRTPNIGKGRLILEGVHRVSKEIYDKRNERAVPKKNDLILAREAPVGNVAIIKGDQEVCLGQRTVLIRPNIDIVDPDFLVYYLLSPEVQHVLINSANGATVSHLNMSAIRKLAVNLPKIEEQRKIGRILSSLADKIEINKQINRNLLEQTEALFKSWFEDFEPWNGIMPENWKQGVLGDFVTIKRGGSPRPIQEFLSDDGLRWLKISDVSGLQSPYILDIAEHIIEAGLKKTVHLGEGALVLSNSATPGIPKILDVDSCIHDGWLYFPESQLSNYFLFLFFKSIRSNLVALGNGSVFTNLKTDILKNYSFSKPDIDTLNQFDELVTPMFVAMREVARENHYLSELRDSLLPKLMSGELDISDLDI